MSTLRKKIVNLIRSAGTGVGKKREAITQIVLNHATDRRFKKSLESVLPHGLKSLDAIADQKRTIAHANISLQHSIAELALIPHDEEKEEAAHHLTNILEMSALIQAYVRAELYHRGLTFKDLGDN